MLAEGSVNLTTVRLLAPHLTRENHHEVLTSARGRRKPEVEAIVARLSPRPDVPSTVRKLPAPRAESTAAEPVLLSADSTSTIPGSVDQAVMTPAPGAAFVPKPVHPSPTAAVTVLSPDRYKLQLTISSNTLEKMRLAKDMLAHAVPGGDDAEVLDRAFTALLGELAKKKFAATSTPGRSRARKRGARNPSAAVKRAVWLRDLGRCAFVGPGGHRCGERRFVEFHHIDPYALGGAATVDAIQLRCRRHNDYEGRLCFGRRAPRGGPAPELVPEQVRLSESRSSHEVHHGPGEVGVRP
jgi:hypothetical protein